MTQINQPDKNNSIIDLEESNKNEEDLLGFSSKYKATILKDEELPEINSKLKIKDRKISTDSTSNSISQEYSNLSINSKIINNSLKKEFFNSCIEFNETKKKYQERQRKLSSPLCWYYDDSEQFLSKTQKTYVDIKNSQNFVKKDSFFGGSSKMINCFNKNKIINKNLENKLNLNDNKNNIKEENINKKNINKKNEKNKKLSFNANQINPGMNYNFIPQQNINNNFFLFNNNYQQELIKWNYINLNNLRNNSNNNRKLSYNMEDRIIGNYFNNLLNLNNLNNAYQQIQANLNPILFSYNEEEENKNSNKYKNLSNKVIPHSKNQSDKKPFDKRKGDWFCPECHNLNFAFRIVCNRCKIPKPKENDSDNIVNNEK